MKILDNEFWYCGVAAYGCDMPLSSKSTCVLQLKNNPTVNQMTSVLLSSKGRFIYAEKGFVANFENGNIEISQGEDVFVFSNPKLASLKGAYLEFIQRFSHNQAIELDASLIERPIYNTWIELGQNQSQDGVQNYAKSLLENGFSYGTLMIDDGWQNAFGSWRFNEDRFPSPKDMIDTLHSLGYKIMLWICPYISKDIACLDTLIKDDILLKDEDGLYTVNWWNGSSYCLDLRKSKAIAFIQNQLNILSDMGIDGYKFDGGDSIYLKDMHEPDLQSYLWASLGSSYAFNELRVDFNTQGMSILERLCDKKHSWERGGIASIIPDTLSLGLGGHPISSPDMIGGGEINDFIDIDKTGLDKELIIKNLALAIFMPSVQFSVNLARIMKENLDEIHKIIRVRASIADYYKKLYEHAIISKEPIVRYMEYEYPDCGLQEIIDQFALGQSYIVAPIYKKGDKSRPVYLPEGKWQDLDGNIYNIKSKNEKIISSLPVGLFKKIK